jgi:hypothetical protein
MMQRHPLWREWPLVTAILVTFGSILLVERGILRDTGGIFMYPLDDPFIHLQVARNLALHGVWGINPQEFASASSSLLYTLLLALLSKLFTAQVVIPFIVNCIAACFLLAVIHRWLLRMEVGDKVRAVILVGLVIFLPLPVLVMSGMEHTLQCLFCFLFVTGLAEWLEEGVGAMPGRRRLPVKLVVYGILVTAIRYEGMFLVAMGCLVILYRRKWSAVFVLGFAALLPIVLFGVYSVRQGSYFLPNSVLVKSENLPFSLKGGVEYINNILINKLTVVKAPLKAVGSPPPGISLLAAQRLLLLFPLAYLFYFRVMKEKRVLADILVMVTGCTLLHLALAATGWLYRYEAYLVMMALVVVPVVVYRSRGQGLYADRKEEVYGSKQVTFGFKKDLYGLSFAILLLFALLFPFVLRSAAAYSNIRQACVNIYQQQYQMGRFLSKYRAGEAVAANDIGAISYYGAIRTVDLWGLGDITVARSKKGGYWKPAFLDSLVRSRNVKVAIVYDEWFSPELLSRWTKVGSWQVQNNVILGGDTVSFYVTDKTDARVLLGQLKEFQASLPEGVGVVYSYNQ